MAAKNPNWCAAWRTERTCCFVWDKMLTEVRRNFIDIGEKAI